MIKMNSDIVIVADIETVKDPVVLGEFPANKWPPPVGWRVVAIGMSPTAQPSPSRKPAA
jgi:hypothetical protein